MGTGSTWGIVVQARMGSTRLPGKMLRTLHDGRGLFQLVLDRLLAVHPPERIVLATTAQPQDLPLAELARDKGLAVHRGSEQDVLDRFCGAAGMMGWSHLVRVCADNPLIQPHTIAPLAEAGTVSGADYVAYFFRDGLPSIRSHCGLFPEWVALGALERIRAGNAGPLYHEHVTNYIYDHPDTFGIVRLPVPHEYQVRNWRMTVDTEADLDLCARVLGLLGDGAMELERLRTLMEEHPSLVDEMRSNMRDHVK